MQQVAAECTREGPGASPMAHAVRIAAENGFELPAGYDLQHGIG